MALPIKYSFRNALVRWRSTIATVLGIGLVVFVFVLLQSLAAGIEKSSGNTGDPRNVLITEAFGYPITCDLPLEAVA